MTHTYSYIPFASQLTASTRSLAHSTLSMWSVPLSDSGSKPADNGRGIVQAYMRFFWYMYVSHNIDGPLPSKENLSVRSLGEHGRSLVVCNYTPRVWSNVCPQYTFNPHGLRAAPDRIQVRLTWPTPPTPRGSSCFIHTPPPSGPRRSRRHHRIASTPGRDASTHVTART